MDGTAGAGGQKGTVPSVLPRHQPDDRNAGGRTGHLFSEGRNDQFGRKSEPSRQPPQIQPRKDNIVSFPAAVSTSAAAERKIAVKGNIRIIRSGRKGGGNVNRTHVDPF